MRLIRPTVLLAAVVSLSACTPADEQYCNQFGVGGTAEYGKCIAHYHQQEALFDADLAPCAMEADRTYPPSLYDFGRYEHVHGGFGHGGQYFGGRTVRIDPDWYHNREVDRLRARIIEPCMQARGWNSGTDWRAGRRAVSKPAKKLPAAKLPWLD